MSDAADSDLDLDQVASQVGVHYQTVYRWVRTGKLAAGMVNGRYRVDQSDLDAYLRARARPTNPVPPGTARLERAAVTMHAALVSGDESTARGLVVDLTVKRTSVADLIHHVLVPPLRQIGQDWSAGKLSIFVEHRASAIVERLLGEVSPRPRGRRKGTVMVAGVAGDRHSLPTLMAAVTLCDDNWRVEHLGADMPVDELVDFCTGHVVDVAVLTVANPECARLAGEARDRIQASGTTVLVGEPGRTLDELLVAVGAASASRKVGGSRRSD